MTWYQLKSTGIDLNQRDPMKSIEITCKHVKCNQVRSNEIQCNQMSAGETRWIQERPLSPTNLLSIFNWPYRYIYIYIYISRDRVTLGCIVRWAPLEKLIHAPRQGDRRLASWRHTLHSWYEKTEGGVPGEIPGDLQKKRRRTTQDS